MCIYEGVLRVHDQQHQLVAAILAIVIVKERSRFGLYDGSVPIQMQQHQLDAAILAVVIVKERSRFVYIIMVVYPWRAASTNATTPA